MKGLLTSWDFIVQYTVMIPAAPQETVGEAGIETVKLLILLSYPKCLWTK
jgi:hypothetical protein